MDSDEESSDIEWEMPTRRKFLSLSQNDLLGQSASFLFSADKLRQSDVMIDQSPLIDDAKMDETICSPTARQSRYSMRKSKSDKITDGAMQKIFDEQSKMRQELQLQYEQFAEYQEIQKMEQEMHKVQQMRLKEDKELRQRELEKENERRENLKKLNSEKELELDKIKEIISLEFSKRDNELQSKQNEIEKLRKALEEKAKIHNDLNEALKLKSTENEAVIITLRNKISELQRDQTSLIKDEEIEENKKEIAVTEHKIENIEINQAEILKEMHDNIELHETLEIKVNKLMEDEIEVIEEQKSLEVQKTKEIKRRSKNAWKKFDIRRANLIMEAEIEFEHIRERKSLINREAMMNNVKLKMRKQFKEQMMRLRLQLNGDKKKLPFTKISNTFFGEASFSFACSDNGELCACVGNNNIFHVIDIRNGNDLYFHSLKGVAANYDEDVNDDGMEVIDIQWDKDSSMVGILLNKCTWIGVWNSLTEQFYEFCVEDNDDIVASFAWSNNQLLLGMDCGDIHIKNMNDLENKMMTIPNKMRGNIDICRWSADDKFGIVVNQTHIAIVDNIGSSVERIGSKQIVSDIQCGIVNDNNVLTVISANNLIFHGINDKSKRKLMSFDAEYGHIVCHCWCRNCIIVAFAKGHIIVLDASTYQNKHLKVCYVVWL